MQSTKEWYDKIKYDDKLADYFNSIQGGNYKKAMMNQQERRYQDNNQPKGQQHLLQSPPNMKDIPCRAVRSH